MLYLLSWGGLAMLAAVANLPASFFEPYSPNPYPPEDEDISYLMPKALDA